MNELVGKSYTFEDGSKIEVIQMKSRELEAATVPCVTYCVSQGRSIPRKLVMSLTEFVDTYGHLFGLKNAHNQ
jgi:hypothetical protein